jgi:hypothetical protein
MGKVALTCRVAMIVMDYPNLQRLKIYGRARVVYQKEEPDVVAQLSVRPSYSEESSSPSKRTTGTVSSA